MMNGKLQLKCCAETLNVKIYGRSHSQTRDFNGWLCCRRIYRRFWPSAINISKLKAVLAQPNARVCMKMLEWACQAAGTSNKDLLELYCGNGNFTLPLSTKFRRVLATELAKSSVYAAQWNIEKNAIDNIQVARLSAEELTQAYNSEREFHHLQEANIDLTSYEFDTVFVDPPRAGIDDETLKLLQRLDRILYISCNPDTLYENLKNLKRKHITSRSFALFDQFPYTHHVDVWCIY